MASISWALQRINDNPLSIVDRSRKRGAENGTGPIMKLDPSRFPDSVPFSGFTEAVYNALMRRKGSGATKVEVGRHGSSRPRWAKRGYGVQGVPPRPFPRTGTSVPHSGHFCPGRCALRS